MDPDIYESFQQSLVFRQNNQITYLTDDGLQLFRDACSSLTHTANHFWDSLVDIEEIRIGGIDHHPGAAVVPASVHRVKTSPNVNRPCLVYFHGGGAVACHPADFSFHTNRYAVEADATIVSVDYRLAPEHKAPAGLYDSYAALKWVIAHADELGIDALRVGIYGGSGGGWVTAGVGMMLGERDESHLVRFQMPQVPQTGNMYVRGEPDSFFTEVEMSVRQDMQEIYQLMAVDPKSQINDPWMFPNLMGNELAKKVPFAIIYTTEFDMFRKMAEELRDLLAVNGRLLDYGVLPGATHGDWASTPRADTWFNDFGLIAAKYLH